MNSIAPARGKSDELLGLTSKGRFSLPIWRIDNAEGALAYFVSQEPRAG